MPPITKNSIKSFLKLKIVDTSNKNGDDDPSTQILIERFEKIEKLAENLAKTTRGLASMSKVIRSFNYKKLRDFFDF